MLEVAPIVCTVVGLATFAGYFSYILVRVPRHWGVQYKRRLTRYLDDAGCAKHGYALEILNAVFSILLGVIFVMETYAWSSNYTFVVMAFSLELFFNGFFLCNYALCFYLARDKRWYLVSFQAIVDLVTIVPSYALLPLEQEWQAARGSFFGVYRGLKITRIIRLARLLRAITFFSGGPALAFDRPRQIIALRAQFIRHALQTIVAIFVLAGMTNFLVEVQGADWGIGDGNMPFHDALYYTIVSLSTVGYGDISPSTALSRLLISVLILSLFFCAPLITNSIINLTRLTPKHGGRLGTGLGSGHIVLGCDSSCLRVVSVLLRELLAPSSMSFHTAHIVVMVPQEPTLAWQALLFLQPNRAVTYLNGDFSSAEDLRRARVGHARACFVLSDRLARDTAGQDRTALVRALCVHQACPSDCPVLCLVTHRESKRQLIRLGLPASGIVCYDNVMEKFVVSACLHPGFSTIWSNALSSMPEAAHLLRAKAAQGGGLRGVRATEIFETEMEYLRSLHRGLIRFHLGPTFCGEKVGDVAVELYRQCRCTLFALNIAATIVSPADICSNSSTGIGTAAVSLSREYGGAGNGRGESAGRRWCTKVHPGYGTVVREDDVGVFIGDSRQAADRLARYCSTRTPPKASTGPPAAAAKNTSIRRRAASFSPPRSSATSLKQRDFDSKYFELNPLQHSSVSRIGDGGGGWRNRVAGEQGQIPRRERLAAAPTKEQARSRAFSSGSVDTAADSARIAVPHRAAGVTNDVDGAVDGASNADRVTSDRSLRIWAQARGERAGESMRTGAPKVRAAERSTPLPPVGLGLLVPVPGRILVIAQSLAASVGVVHALCAASSRSITCVRGEHCARFPSSSGFSSSHGNNDNNSECPHAARSCPPAEKSFCEAKASSSQPSLEPEKWRGKGGSFGITESVAANVSSAASAGGSSNDHYRPSVADANAIVTVLCPPGPSRDPAGDEIAARELAVCRHPSVRLHKAAVGRRGLLECGADSAELICIVSGGGHQGQSLLRDVDGIEVGFGGLGNRGGGRQGSDGWAMSAFVDVFCVVSDLARVVVRFDDAASAEQHQVISAHVRGGGAAAACPRATFWTAKEENRRRLRRVHHWDDDECLQEEKRGEQQGGNDGTSGVFRRSGATTDGQKYLPTPPELSHHEGTPSRSPSVVLSSGQNARIFADESDTAAFHVSEVAAATGPEVGAEGEDGGDMKSGKGINAGGGRDDSGGGDGGYFEDVRGGRQPGFEGFFAIMSGYASGDVIVGNVAELLLLQAMLADDIQSLFNGILRLVSRVPVEELWPRGEIAHGTSSSSGSSGSDDRSGRGGGSELRRPTTYGEAYESLLQDRDLLPLGLHRPPPSFRRSSCGSNRSDTWVGMAQPQGTVQVWPAEECDGGHCGGGDQSRGDNRAKMAYEPEHREAGDAESGPASCFPCPSALQNLAISCPSPHFPLRDGDGIFVLRRDGEKNTTEVASRAAAGNVSPSPVVADTTTVPVVHEGDVAATGIAAIERLSSSPEFATSNDRDEEGSPSARQESRRTGFDNIDATLRSPSRSPLVSTPSRTATNELRSARESKRATTSSGSAAPDGKTDAVPSHVEEGKNAAPYPRSKRNSSIDNESNYSSNYSGAPSAIREAGSSKNLVEWALGLLARSSPYRLNCYGADSCIAGKYERKSTDAGAATAASINDDEGEASATTKASRGHKDKTTRRRCVVDAALKQAAISVDLPPISLSKDGGNSRADHEGGRGDSGNGDGGGTGSEESSSAVKTPARGARNRHMGQDGNRMDVQGNGDESRGELVCGGCGYPLAVVSSDAWYRGNDRNRKHLLPLILGCGHAVCLDCLDGSSMSIATKAAAARGQDKTEEPTVLSSSLPPPQPPPPSWCCPACSAPATAVLPVVGGAFNDDETGGNYYENVINGDEQREVRGADGLAQRPSTVPSAAI